MQKIKIQKPGAENHIGKLPEKKKVFCPAPAWKTPANYDIQSCQIQKKATGHAHQSADNFYFQNRV